MFRSWPFRILLLALLTAGIIAIAVSIRSRTEHPLEEEASADLLTPEIARRSTAFEYSQLKGGEAVFRVTAGVSTMTRNNEHLLEQVHLVRLDETGRETDTIDATTALYRIPEKELEFREDVTIAMADGTRIFADWAGADLAREVVVIRERFRFTRAALEGTGRGLRYEILPRELAVSGGLDLSFLASGKQGRSTAGQAVYDLRGGLIRLRDKARVALPAYLLNASDIRLQLDEATHLEELSAVGSATLRLGNEREFSGARIDVVIPGSKGRPGGLSVFSSDANPPDRDASSARFTERTASGRNELRASRIDAPFHEKVGGDRATVILDSLSGTGRARISSDQAGLEQGLSERFHAELGGPGEGIRRLDLEGNVYLLRRVLPQQPAVRDKEELWSRRLDLQFDDTGLLSRCIGRGPVRIRQEAAESMRELNSGGDALIQYHEGRPKRIEAQGGCRMESRSNRERLGLAASRLSLDFSGEGPERGRAEGEVDLSFSGQDETLESQGRTLLADFESGVLEKVTIQGDFRLSRTDSSGILEVEGEEGRFSLADAMLRVEGKERPRIVLESEKAKFRTRARQVQLSRLQQQILAEGQVESASEENGVLSVVTADRMNYRGYAGWVEYLGQVRMIQGDNLITAGEMRIHRERGELSARNSVRSIWVDRQGSETKEFNVESGRLQVLSSEDRAVYEESVTLRAEGLLLRAPRLDAFFAAAPKQGVERIEASGGVEIEERGRRWNTEKAVYFRDTERVVAVK